MSEQREVLAVYLFRTLGWRKGSKVVAFVASWGIYSESLLPGDERSLGAYGAYWSQSRATCFREQELFRQAFPGYETPELVWRQVRSTAVLNGDRDTVAATLMAARGSWAA